MSFPQKLSRQIDVFTKYPEINLLFHDFKLIDKQGIIEEKTYLENSSFNIRAAPYLQKIDEHVYKCLSSFYCFMSIQLTSLHVSSVMVRRKALFNEPIWFEEEFIIGEDIDLWFRLAKHNNTFFLDEALSSYRLHDESITKNEARLLEGAISAHTKNLSRGADIFTADEKRIYAKKIAKNHLNQAYLFYKKMEMPKARECLKMARRLSKDVSIFKFYIKTFTPIFIIKIKDNLFK